ncbi:unnamed protein product [Mycena citricolor]|uniref:Galactan 1,3-beta-galactosidase n=1 Tax=Mycena citricolor TaxID=2018698 RepID=A0AAD2HQC0_9AGAR|nr:unnamed protein product [Mycena citricolor]
MRFLSLLACVVAAKAVLIVPGAVWTDTQGNTIQAHGAGILKVGSTFYWFGEDKAANSALFSAVSCYSSTDLGTWTRHNNALTPIAGSMISNNSIVERPKVIYNKANKEYVMWFHSDTSNYGAAMVGVAVSTTPCGPYTYRGSWNPLGAQSRDEGLFQDADIQGTAYLLYASDNNQNFKITQLDSNYYNVTTQVNQLTGSTLEAPGIVKRNGSYYLFASHTSGWAPNPNKWFVSSSLSTAFSGQSDMSPPNNRTWYSQNAYDLPLGNGAIYMGDRWRADLLGTSSYIWLPMTWASGSPQLIWADLWDLDITAGTYTIPTGTVYEAEKGVIAGSAVLLGASSAFSNNLAVGYLGNGGTVTLTVQGIGAAQWISVYFANGDSGWRTSTVSVNGGAPFTLVQPSSGGGQVTLSVPMKVNLKKGANTLLFSASTCCFQTIGVS